MSAVNEETHDIRNVKTHSLTAWKHLLYLIVASFSLVLFVLCCVVATFEKDRYRGYNLPLGELAFTGACGTICLPLLVWSQKVRPDSKINSLAVELGTCSFMWLFLLSGATALASQTYDLVDCQNLFICRGFSTVMAFAWLSWMIITVMIAYKLMIVAKLWSLRIAVQWFAPEKHVRLVLKTGAPVPMPQSSAAAASEEKVEENPV